MTKVYFHTQVFDDYLKNSDIVTTTLPEEADFLVLGAKKIDFKKFKNLKTVYRFGVGADNIDFEYLNKNNVSIHFPAETTKQILYDETANFTVFALLKMMYQNKLGNIETWKKDQRPYLGNMNILVVGLGNIGQKVLVKLQPFFNVSTFDTQQNTLSELRPLLNKANALTVHIPLDEKTLHFFDQTKLSWLSNDAVIINTARGALFDENALYEKLTHSNCRAFFDVFWEEPYHGKLKNLGPEKFFMTPHSASNAKEFIDEGFAEILKIYRK